MNDAVSELHARSRFQMLVRHMLKNNVPAPSCIPPAGLEVLTRRFVLVLERGYSYDLALQLCGSALSELHPRSGLKMLKGTRILRAISDRDLWRALNVRRRIATRATPSTQNSKPKTQNPKLN